jgi:hypothetical protein
VVRLGQPPSLLVCRLAGFVVVRSPDKHAVTRGRGCHLATAFPTVVEWSLQLDHLECSPTVVWSWLKWGSLHAMLPWKGEVRPPFPVRSRGEPHDGSSHHGPLWEWWLAIGRAHDNGV